MTKAQDVREAIAENSVTPAERRAMEVLADRLEETLTADVPHRPQFKAELRSRLVAQARRQMTPAWYRRPAVWGSAMAVAAAVGILAVGLQMWGPAGPGPKPAGETAQAPANPVTPATPGVNPSITAKQVNTINLPVVALAPEVLPAGHPGPESIGGLQQATELNLYLASGRPDEAQFARMASGLAFTGKAVTGPRGFSLTEGTRTLTMTLDGAVTYEDRTADSAGAAMTAEKAQAAARTFLENAALPIPTLTPAVLVNDKGVWAVEYTPRVDGRLIVNARTLIQISPGGKVVQAGAFVQQTYQAAGPYSVNPAAEALRQARAAADATYDGVDLVYARTLDREAVYLQPYWRVFGVNSQGARVVRYVPALQHQ
ncbi:MAG TPA: hypothetical protein VK464_25005 [Symbiobacteriaceae bacterium]|jgi:hypothetical protein|nr:hypothetical protein [Symbiobacteriaceae bacterium]